MSKKGSLKSVFNFIINNSDKFVFGGLLVIIIWVGWNRTWYVGRFNWADDFIWANRIDRILAGQVPYRDFFELYGPLFPYVLAPFYLLFGKGLPAIRLILYLLFPMVTLATMVGLLNLAEIKKWRAAIGLGIVSGSFMGMVLLNHPNRIWFGMAVIALIALAYKKNNKILMIISGLATIIVGLLSTEQGVATVIAGFGTGILLLLPKKRGSVPGGELREKLSKVIFFGLGVGGGVIGVILVMMAGGMLGKYIQIALEQIPNTQNAAFGFVFPGYDVVNHPSRIIWFIPFAAYFLGFGYWSFRYLRRQGVKPIILLLLIFGGINLRVYIGRTELGHLAMDSSPIWILSVLTWFDWWKSKNKLVQEVIFTVLLSIAAVTISLVMVNNLSPYWRQLVGRGLIPEAIKERSEYWAEGKVWVFPDEAEAVGNVIHFVRTNIGKDEEVYPFAVISGFSTLTGRVTPNYFEQAWFAQTIRQQQQLIRDIEERKVPWVIYSPRDDVIRLDQISEDYILATYKPVEQDGEYVIMKRDRNWTDLQLAEFFQKGTKLENLTGINGVVQNGSGWTISNGSPQWAVDCKTPGGCHGKTIVLKYKLGVPALWRSLSKTALKVSWKTTDGNVDTAVYQEPFLLPDDKGGEWQEAWVRLPGETDISSLNMTLSWPGGLNPRASYIEIGEVRIRE